MFNYDQPYRDEYCCDDYPHCSCREDKRIERELRCICGNPDCDGTCDKGLEDRECPY